MRFSLFSFFLLIIICSSQAQFSSEQWHKGYLVTTDQDTLSGKIKYNMETNIIQFQRRNNLKAYSSFNVLYFEIFDKILQNYRQFYTLPYALKSNYKTPIIFELLYEGGLSLLAREKIVQETVSAMPYSPMMGPVRQNALRYDYFFLEKNGEMIYFTGNKNDLLRIMGDKRREVRNFMKSNKLKPDVMRDLIRITSFYNSI
jgi:hypothetical protein